MAFYEEMGITSNTYELPPEHGPHLVKLMEVKTVEGTKWMSDEKQINLQWCFEFVDACNSSGEKHQVSYFSGTNYTADDRAKITKVIMGLFGRVLSVKEFKKLESRNLIGRPVKVVIQYKEKPTGTKANISTFIPTDANDRTKPSQPANSETSVPKFATTPDKSLPKDPDDINFDESPF